MVAHGGLEEGERAGGEVVRFEERELVFGQVRAGFGLEFSGREGVRGRVEWGRGESAY